MCLVLARFATFSLQLGGFTVYHGRHGHERDDGGLERAKPTVDPSSRKLVGTTGHTTSERWQPDWRCWSTNPEGSEKESAFEGSATSADSERQGCSLLKLCSFCGRRNSNWLETSSQRFTDANCFTANYYCANSWGEPGTKFCVERLEYCTKERRGFKKAMASNKS